jgi:hypothetical protein
MDRAKGGFSEFTSAALTGEREAARGDLNGRARKLPGQHFRRTAAALHLKGCADGREA